MLASASSACSDFKSASKWLGASPSSIEFSQDHTTVMGKDKPVFVITKSAYEYNIVGEHSLAKYPSPYEKFITNVGKENYHMSSALSDS